MSDNQDRLRKRGPKAHATQMPRPIRLQDLSMGAPGLTPAAGSYLAEAAAVCLTECEHTSGVTLPVTGDYSEAFSVLWDVTTGQMLRTHADSQEATEHGACGVAILMMQSLTGLSVLSRSRKGTGFDYWVGRESARLFQDKARLEVSGILRGEGAVIDSRERRKQEQTKQSDSLRLPAFVVIVEFSSPRSLVTRR